MRMQTSEVKREEEERYADGVREYATYYGGPAVHDPSHSKPAGIGLHERHQSAPILSTSTSTQSLSSKQIKAAARYRPRKSVSAVLAGQQGTFTRDDRSGNAAAYSRSLGASRTTNLPEVNRRVQLSSEAPELRPSHLPELAQHRTVSWSSEARLDQISYQSQPLAENLPEVNSWKDLSSQAPEVETSTLPEPGSPALLSRFDTAAGLHTLARDPIKDHYRLDVLSRLEVAAATDILQRLESTGLNPTGKLVDPERRSSLVTSLRQAFIKPRPLTSVPLLSVLERVASEGNLPLVKATIALAREPIFLPPEQSYNELAIKHAARHGHQNVVEYIISRSIDFGLDDSRGWGSESLTTIALFEAVRAKQVDLAINLISSRKANVFLPISPPMIEDSTAPRTIFGLIARMDYQHETLTLLRAVMAPKYLTQVGQIKLTDVTSQPNADFRLSIQEAFFWFVKEGWADALELLLDSPMAKLHISFLMRDDQDVAWLNFEIRAFGFGAWDSKSNAAMRTLRILRLLVHKSEYLQSGHHSTNRDILQRALTHSMSQAISLDVPDAINLIVEIDFALLKKRITENGVSRSPLAWAIYKEKFKATEALLRKGACPTDWVDKQHKSGNNLQLAVHRTAAGHPVAQQILSHMLAQHSELIYDAICEAIRCIHPLLVTLLLEAVSRKACPDATSFMRLYEVVLSLRGVSRNEKTLKAYLDMIDTIYNWDTANILPHVQAKAVQRAVKNGNRVGLEKLLKVGVVDRAQLDEVLEWCMATSQKLEWRSLLRFYGAQERVPANEPERTCELYA
ncbi:hypothetical protein BKA63DRAFT_1075 [Paraphoma chrysanthemicola]|nr:hypothetical protein BKA63DRAFT_1075 [Paraphoma chrysanthemicola]